MVHSSFLKLLGTLSKKEILSFHAFSQGAHAQKKICNQLFSYILSHGTNKEDWKEISIEDAYLAAFNQTYSSRKHRKKVFNTLADLDTRLNNYLIWKEVQQSTIIRQLILSRIYFKRGLTNRFDKTIRSAINKMESISNGFWQSHFLVMFYHLSYFNSNAVPLLCI